MEEGEKKSVHLEAGEAYGEFDPNAITELSKETFPEQLVDTIQVGSVIPLSTKEFPDRAFPATATEVKESTIVFNLNHPLAGKNVNFDIELVAVETAETAETEETDTNDE
jgi:FKBP-type peptidyl-prolyl cis-trans isomerase SlyD